MFVKENPDRKKKKKKCAFCASEDKKPEHWPEIANTNKDTLIEIKLCQYISMIFERKRNDLLIFKK